MTDTTIPATDWLRGLAREHEAEIERLEARTSKLEEALSDLMLLAANSKASKKNPNTTFVDTRDWQAFTAKARALLTQAEPTEVNR